MSINLTHKMGKNESNYFKVKILIPDKLNEYNIFPHIWFSLKSDKCCIEGGKITRADRENIVTLPKPYADNTYTVLLQPWHTALNTDGRPVLCYETKKTDVSFDINMYSGLGGAYWTTIGYVN